MERIENIESREQEPETKERYVGSVLFFKRMLLAVVILLVAIPTALALHLGVSLRGQQAQTDLLEDRLAASEAARAAAEAALKVPQNEDGADPDPGSQSMAVPAGEAPEYTKLYPDLYAEPANYGSVDVENSAYLTFDDGPSARTDEILAILAQYNIKATFFVVGTSSEEGLQRMRNIVEAGHTLAIHSYTHDYQKIYASVEAYLEDFNQMYCQIVEATGVKPQIFRFPGGSINSYNGTIYMDIIAEMTRRGFVYFDWNAANGDAVSRQILPASTLVENALASTGTRRRAVILMHDSASKTTTVEALPAIIEGYLEAGFTFSALTAETKAVIFGYRS